MDEPTKQAEEVPLPEDNAEMELQEIIPNKDDDYEPTDDEMSEPTLEVPE